jgi:hypothetical protein
MLLISKQIRIELSLTIIDKNGAEELEARAYCIEK